MSLAPEAITANMRRAALALHALSATDRAWVISQLPAEQQQVVKPLLEELADLGIPPDVQVVRQVLEVQGAQPAAGSAMAESDLAALRSVLQEEPVSMHPWLLAVLPLAQREAALMNVDPSTVSFKELPQLSPALGDSLERALRERRATVPRAA